MNSIGTVVRTCFDGQNFDAVSKTIRYWMAVMLIRLFYYH